MKELKGDFQRLAVTLETPEGTAARETYGFAGSLNSVILEGQLLRNAAEAETLWIFMHPSSTLNLLPMPAEMARQGHHVLCAASRYMKNDSALIMEKVVLDLGNWVRWAREVAGYRRVILCGWSGGGSLALFYQSQALNPTITESPSGEPVDVVGAGLIPADAIALVAAHLSRAETLTGWIDPSVRDELNPDDRDPVLDIYAANPAHKPPFSADFVAAFRAAQAERNHRITAAVWDTLNDLRDRGGPERERAFVVHRTMCDVRWIDPALEPNGRPDGTCYLGDPRAANVGAIGLARFSTLRSWLSQWSISESRCLSAPIAAGVGQTPVLQIENTADDAVPTSHQAITFAALSTQDKTQVKVEGATHYYKGQPAELAEAVAALVAWATERKLLG